MIESIFLAYTEMARSCVVWGRIADAEALLRAALREAEGPWRGDMRVLSAQIDLSSALLTQQKTAEAVRPLEEVVRRGKKAYGPEHPWLAAHLFRLAATLFVEKDYAESEAAYLRALGIWERAAGPDSSQVAACLRNLGAVARARRRRKAALSLYARAIAIWDKLGEAESMDLEHGLIEFAKLLETNGDAVNAAAARSRAEAMRVRRAGSSAADGEA